MARARNIKPSFFQNEDLAECGPYAMILFEGLWCHADREGRLEDRPKRLKVQILPYFDNVNVDELLTILHNEEFIVRYETEIGKYIQILNFVKHQNPHKNEPESTIPEYKNSGEIMINPDLSGAKQDEAGSTPADSLLLIPDPLNPNGSDANASVADKPSLSPPCSHQSIIDLYHQALPMCPQVRIWTAARQKSLKTRWREDSKRQSISWWERFFAYIATSDFLTGRGQPKPGAPPFIADLEWILKPANMAKIIEGKYHNAQQS